MQPNELIELSSETSLIESLRLNRVDQSRGYLHDNLS